MPGRRRHQQREQVVLVLDGRVEPARPAVLLDHQRHPVVDVADVVLGVGGDHRAGPPEAVGVVVGLVGVAPDLVEPGHGEDAVVLGPDEERLLERLAGLAELLGGVPLVVAVGRQQAAPRRERAPERGLLGDRLHARVDHPAADLGVLGPGRDQAPGQRAELPLGGHALLALLLGRRPLDDGVHLLGRGDVVVGLEGRRHAVVDDLELLDEVLGPAAGGVATAHAAHDSRRAPTHPGGRRPAGDGVV